RQTDCLIRPLTLYGSSAAAKCPAAKPPTIPAPARCRTDRRFHRFLLMVFSLYVGMEERIVADPLERRQRAGSAGGSALAPVPIPIHNSDGRGCNVYSERQRNQISGHRGRGSARQLDLAATADPNGFDRKGPAVMRYARWWVALGSLLFAVTQVQA